MSVGFFVLLRFVFCLLSSTLLFYLCPCYVYEYRNPTFSLAQALFPYAHMYVVLWSNEKILNFAVDFNGYTEVKFFMKSKF